MLYGGFMVKDLSFGWDVKSKGEREAVGLIATTYMLGLDGRSFQIWSCTHNKTAQSVSPLGLFLGVSMGKEAGRSGSRWSGRAWAHGDLCRSVLCGSGSRLKGPHRHRLSPSGRKHQVQRGLKWQKTVPQMGLCLWRERERSMAVYSTHWKPKGSSSTSFCV